MKPRLKKIFFKKGNVSPACLVLLPQLHMAQTVTSSSLTGKFHEVRIHSKLDVVTSSYVTGHYANDHMKVVT